VVFQEVGTWPGRVQIGAQDFRSAVDPDGFLRAIQSGTLMIDSRSTGRLTAATLAVAALSAHAQSPMTSDEPVASLAAITAAQRAAERSWSNAAASASALTLHDSGFRGRGVRVNVMDTGVRATHTEFGGRVLLPQSRNVTLASPAAGTGIVDGHGHGTYVASIIAGGMDGRGFEGVAPEAFIISSQVMSAATGWSASAASLLAGVRNGVNGGAFIHNMSLGAGGPVGEAAMREAVARGTLSVVAAGNSGLANPDWPARYAKEAWAENRIIAVGAVDGSNRIASFSNRAGDTANWYVVALGVNVIGAGASSNSAYVSGSGTSMATPIVSGVAALLKSRWPILTASQVGQIIFATAKDLGAPGVDPIYGRGLVDASRAMQPVGATGARTASGKWNFNTQGTLLTTTGAWSSKIASYAASGLLDPVVFDDYARDFQVSLATSVATPQPVGFEGLAAMSDRQIGYAEKVLDPRGSRMLMATETRLDLMRQDGVENQSLANYQHRFRGQQAMLGAAMVRKLEGGSQFGMGTGGMNAFFGLQGMDTVSTSMLAQGLQNPMLGLLPLAQSAGVAVPFAGDWDLKVGLASSQGSSIVGDQLGLGGGSALRQNLTLAEMNRRFDDGRTVVGVQMTNLSESSSLMGGQGYGLFAMGGMRSETQALTLQGATRLAEDLVLGAQFTSASLPAGGTDGSSLVTGNSDMKLSGWGLGLTRSSAFMMGDRFALTVSEPLAVRSGAMLFDIPSTVDASGAPVYTRQTVSLAGSARERLYEMTWMMPFDKGAAALMMSGLVRQHALGNGDARPEVLATIRLQRAF
jgi:hypothetical protein